MEQDPALRAHDLTTKAVKAHDASCFWGWGFCWLEPLQLFVREPYGLAGVGWLAGVCPEGAD